MGGNASNNPEIIEIAGLDNAKGMMFTTEPLPKDLDYPEAKQFLADYKAKYNEDAESVWWVMAADAFRVIKNAMEQTKGTDTTKLAEYLHNNFKNFPGITGPILGFDAKGDRLGTHPQGLRDHRHGRDRALPEAADYPVIAVAGRRLNRPQ